VTGVHGKNALTIATAIRVQQRFIIDARVNIEHFLYFGANDRVLDW